MFSIIIQGPLNEISLSNLKYYNSIGKVIISYWDTDDESILNKYDIKNVELIKNHLPKDSIRYFNYDNIYYQIYTTYKALRIIQTKFTIKTRSDNKFTNLYPLINSVYNNNDKISCSNLHFKPTGYLPFHTSDNILGGKTDLILKTFEISKYRCEYDQLLLISGIYDETTYFDITKKYKTWNKNIPKIYTTKQEDPIIGLPKLLFNNFLGVVPETIFTTSFLMSKNIKIDIEKEKELISDNFNIIDIKNLEYINKYGNNIIDYDTFLIDDNEEFKKNKQLLIH